ncbi:MAG: ribulose-phosphate 3-epimerase [Balneolales bacterium]
MINNLPLVAPSILAADFSNLEKDINSTLEGGAKWIHCDIMDGHFVPNISYGPAIVEATKKSGQAFLDVHLMIYNPDQYISDFVKAGAGLISVHSEATPHIHRTVQLIKDEGIQAGVAVNPGTPLTVLSPILDEVQLVVLMSVNPGFGGQKFIESTIPRLLELKTMREERGLSFLIEIDGGVTTKNIENISRSGADVLVAGSSIFKADNISQRTAELIKKAKLGKSTLV